MQYQLAILTHEKSSQPGALPKTKLMKIIVPIALKKDAIHVAQTMQPFIYPMDTLMVYNDSTDKVVWKYEMGEVCEYEET